MRLLLSPDNQPLYAVASMNGMQLETGSVSASPRPEPVVENESQQLTAQFFQDTSRIDVDSLMNEFRRQLGAAKWDKYRDSLTHFLMGKLTRAELVRTLQDSLGMSSAGIRNHNILILSLLASACRELPPGTESSLAEWRTKSRSKSRYAGVDSSNDLLHREILSLPGRERKRIKAIAKESATQASSGKRPVVYPPPPMILATRQALLPHIPYVQDLHAHREKEKAKSREDQAAASSQITTGAKSGAKMRELKEAKEAAAKEKESTPTTATQASSLLDPSSSLHAGRNSGPLTWTQDVIQGLDAPLATESFEIPDDAVVGSRMLGIALEHGLLDGIGAGSTDIMLLGVENYLRGIVEQLVSLKHRKISSADPLNAADLDLFMDMNPTEIGDISAPMFRLKANFLHDEETVTSAAPEASVRNTDPLRPDKHSGSDADSHTNGKSSHKRATPLDFPLQQKLKFAREEDHPRSSDDQQAQELLLLKEHENGLKLLGDLLK